MDWQFWVLVPLKKCKGGNVKSRSKQRGGTVLGLIVGVLIGLGMALGISVYVLKVPTPFNSKSASRTPAQDAAEAKKNQDWDPNAGLAKPIAKPAASAAPAPADDAQPAEATQSPAAGAPAADALPEYYVQVGAFRSSDDAQALRGKLALSGFDGKVFEREQAGQKIFRVRVGPYAGQAVADKAKGSLEAAGFETSLVRSQK